MSTHTKQLPITKLCIYIKIHNTILNTLHHKKKIIERHRVLYLGMEKKLTRMYTKYIDKRFLYTETLESTYRKYIIYKQHAQERMRQEYIDRLDKKKNPHDRYERDNFNPLEKEKELFFEFEKTNIHITHTIIHNKHSHFLMIPSSKDIKKIYKDPRIVSKYYMDTKRLEKIFTASHYIQIKNKKINQIVKHSTIHKLQRITHENVTINNNAIKAPPSILKECRRLHNVMGYVNKQSKIDISYITFYNSIYIKKFTNDLLWSLVFLNRICRDLHSISKKVLIHTYNIYYKVLNINNDLLTIKYVTKELRKEIVYRKTLFISILWAYISTDVIKITQDVPREWVVENYIYLQMKMLILGEKVQATTKNRIVYNYIPYVTLMSKQYLRSGYYAELTDLIQEGTYGIIDAIDRYQLGRGVRFLTYAYWWMHRYMIKVAIKKKRYLKINSKHRKQRKLTIHISKLYSKIIKKLKTTDSSMPNLHIINNTLDYNNLHSKMRHKDIVLFCLYASIYPYKQHTIDNISHLFEISPDTILNSMKKIKQKLE